MAETYPIAKAVRMSMSIPIFYKPFILRDQSGKKTLYCGRWYVKQLSNVAIG